MNILCVGSFTQDVFIRIGDRIDFNNEERTHFSADQVHINHGGCAANIAYGMNKLGINATVCGSLRDEDYITSLKSLGIPIIGNNKDKEIDKYVIISENNSQRLTFFNRGSGPNLFSLGEDDISGYSDILISGDAKDNMSKTKKMASQAGRFCHLDIGGEIYNLNKVELLNLANNTKTIFLNDKEIFYAKELGVSKDTLISCCDYLIVTHGGNGAYAYTKAGTYFQDSPDVLYVDETGCGDAFRAGFLFSMYSSTDDWSNRDPSKWLRKGHDMAAQCIRTIGGQNY